MATKPSYTVKTIDENDRNEVLEFLRRFFFRDEPMNLAVNLLETPESRCLELEDYACESLKDGISVAAVDDDGQIVGIILNGIARKEEISEGDKPECGNPKFQRILRVLQHLDKEAKIWEKLPDECNTVVEIRIASTHSDWRGRGLMRVLCDETERIANKLGAGALRMDASSAFSAAAAERSGYKKVYSVPYADLPYAPQPAAPHFEARVYLKEI